MADNFTRLQDFRRVNTEQWDNARKLVHERAVDPQVMMSSLAFEPSRPCTTKMILLLRGQEEPPDLKMMLWAGTQATSRKDTVGIIPNVLLALDRL